MAIFYTKSLCIFWTRVRENCWPASSMAISVDKFQREGFKIKYVLSPKRPFSRRLKFWYIFEVELVPSFQILHNFKSLFIKSRPNFSRLITISKNILIFFGCAHFKAKINNSYFVSLYWKLHNLFFYFVKSTLDMNFGPTVAYISFCKYIKLFVKPVQFVTNGNF